MIARPRTFLLDENMPRKILTSLRREGFNATWVYDTGLRSRPDTAIFAYACAYHMTIITFDTDYLNQTAFPPPHAGIIVLRSFPRDTTVNKLASAVLKAVAQLAHLDISNRVYGQISDLLAPCIRGKSRDHLGLFLSTHPLSGPCTIVSTGRYSV